MESFQIEVPNRAVAGSGKKKLHNPELLVGAERQGSWVQAHIFQAHHMWFLTNCGPVKQKIVSNLHAALAAAAAAHSCLMETQEALSDEPYDDL